MALDILDQPKLMILGFLQILSTASRLGNNEAFVVGCQPAGKMAFRYFEPAEVGDTRITSDFVYGLSFRK